MLFCPLQLISGIRNTSVPSLQTCFCLARTHSAPRLKDVPLLALRSFQPLYAASAATCALRASRSPSERLYCRVRPGLLPLRCFGPACGRLRDSLLRSAVSTLGQSLLVHQCPCQIRCLVLFNLSFWASLPVFLVGSISVLLCFRLISWSST